MTSILAVLKNVILFFVQNTIYSVLLFLEIQSSNSSCSVINLRLVVNFSETRNEKLKNVNVNSETQAESVEEEIQELKEEQESMEQRDIKDFQEPEILEEGRNILSEEIKTIEKLEVSGVPEYLQDPEKNAYVASDSQMESVEEQKEIKITPKPLRLETLEGVNDQTAASFDEVGSEIRVMISTEVQLKIC
jgi:hypothetical protein